MTDRAAHVVGGGLAGSECAWQLARWGHRVVLHEMRPGVMTPAHQTGQLAELVCSNSLRGQGLAVAAGVLKEELTILGSLIMEAARAEELPGGTALVVDREQFSSRVTAALCQHPLVTLSRDEVREVGTGGVWIIASGPLTSDALSHNLAGMLGQDHLYFYDAASPIIDGSSMDTESMYYGSRYGKGDPHSYLNIPLDRDLYTAFRDQLASARVHPRRHFEQEKLFEGCLPVEEMARRGMDTLRFGPMKPVGLADPRTGEIPHAVVQLRPENASATLYSMVGFQTNLARPEQERVFSMLPGLEQAVFERFGLMHRNTFIKAPLLLRSTLELRDRPGTFFAGQITGAEGYVEAAATGLWAGLNASRYLRGAPLLSPPKTTMLGGLCHYLETADAARFQPMNAAFGLLPPLDQKVRGRRRRREAMGQRCLEVMEDFSRSVLVQGGGRE